MKHARASSKTPRNRVILFHLCLTPGAELRLVVGRNGHGCLPKTSLFFFARSHRRIGLLLTYPRVGMSEGDVLKSGVPPENMAPGLKKHTFCVVNFAFGPRAGKMLKADACHCRLRRSLFGPLE